MKTCTICKQEMTERDDCGGDCVVCLAEAGDPDCRDIQLKEANALVKTLHMYARINHDKPKDYKELIEDYTNRWRVEV